jgi:hypothetical protein
MALSRIFGTCALALGLTLGACTTAPQPGWQARHIAGEQQREAVRFAEDPLPDAWTGVDVQTSLVPINDQELEAGTGLLVYAGGVEITSGFNRLHGLSDIKFTDADSFYAVSDEGLLVRGQVRLDPAGRLVGVEGVQVRPLTDPDGLPLLPKYLADAEGLAILPDGELLVSFEREHRVWRYDREGRWRGERVIPDFPFTNNEGLEGITAYWDGTSYWAAGENGGLWMCWEVCEVGIVPPPVPPTDSDLRVTSLASTDEGVFVLSRAYHADRNTNTVQIGHLVFALDRLDDGPPVYLQALATWTAPATVDNFEGIAAVRRPDGGVRLYILSDDNFNDGQRTLLLAFDVD